MSTMELRLSGSGGQGVILAAVILAEAAVQAGRYTAQSQSYGPEARGGACKGEVLISDKPIGYTRVRRPSFLMALTQRAMDVYGKDLPADCLVLADESVTPPEQLSGNAVVSLPILRTARETIRCEQAANLVAVGCINELLHITDADTMERSARMHLPRGTEEINLRALAEGEQLASAARPRLDNAV